MKTYTYMMFLRHPVTGQIQQGTIEVDSDGEYLDFHEVLRKLNLEQNLQDFEKGYTLIGMNIVDVQPSKGVEWSPDWSEAPDWANWWALDLDSMIAHWFETKPVRDAITWRRTTRTCKVAPNFDYEGDWKDSLHFRSP